ncbi:type II secretion system protein [uncultured Pseudoteredinibacter sp.]|uniref:type II secretion system protein n=1 Tax=uncultured Pseudoteredinibacter sp. TaxID=1641701 RepID=UPI0026045BBA|nr:type II secretion system protein [uncultured Pseudoteredinibacter sp.]
MKTNAIPNVKAQAGFTLIELVAVIVILGILSATALPRFVDLSDSAEQAALKGVAGALSSASALNHANNLAADAGLSTGTVTVVTSCANAVNLLEGNSLPNSNYAVSGTAPAAADPEGTQFTCNVTYTPSGGTAISESFVAYKATN